MEKHQFCYHPRTECSNLDRAHCVCGEEYESGDLPGEEYDPLFDHTRHLEDVAKGWADQLQKAGAAWEIRKY